MSRQECCCFNAMAWIAQEQSEFRDVFWVSSEDDHLIKNDVEAVRPDAETWLIAPSGRR